jgi:hypothetical protein
MQKAPILSVVFLYVCSNWELEDSVVFLVLRSISHFGVDIIKLLNMLIFGGSVKLCGKFYQEHMDFVHAPFFICYLNCLHD